MTKDITEYLVELNTLKIQLVQNLSSKGVDVNENEGFETLIPKVLDAKGDSSSHVYGSAAPFGSFGSLVYALTSKNFRSGEFTLTEPLGSELGMTIATGLDSIHGFAFWVDGISKKNFPENKGNIASLGILLVDSNGSASTATHINIDGTVPSNVTKELFPWCSSWNIDGENIRVVPKYNKNENYTPFIAGYKYTWVAW